MVNTPNALKQHAVYAWYQKSIYAIGALCVVGALVNAYQYYDLATNGSCKKQLTKTEQLMAGLSQEVRNLTASQEQLAQHARILNTPSGFNPAQYLKELARAIPDDTCLMSADLTANGSMQLNGYTASADSLKMFIHNMHSTALFKAINLTSLQPETPGSTLLRFALQTQLQSVQD